MEAASLKGSDASSTGSTDSPTFAGLLARRAGLRQVRFAVPVRDYPPIARAKRIFGTVAVTRLLARLCRGILELCPPSARK
jgi:hypothetical protein